MAVFGLWASTAFRRDVKRPGKRGRETGKRKRLVALLREGEPRPRDRPLEGERPDRLLLHRVEGQEPQLARTGSHTDLFEPGGA
jgi:mRNA interferase YafQ